jgi:hypothetical protein
MAREYSGDIDGDLWSGQDIDDAKWFGAAEVTPTLTQYHAADLGTCEQRLRYLFGKLGIEPNFDLRDRELKQLGNAWTRYERGTEEYDQQQLWASIALGLKI